MSYVSRIHILRNLGISLEQLLSLRNAGSGKFNSTIAFTDPDDITLVDIEGVAKAGVISVEAAPSAETSNGVITGTMRKTTVDSSDGAWSSTSHGIGGYDYIHVKGGNTHAQHFGHEAKVKKTGSGTINSLVNYKPSTDTIEGTVTNFILYDGDVDLSGITATNKYLIHGNQSDLLAMFNGGILHNDPAVLTDNYTATINDSGRNFITFAGTPITFTVPNIPGFKCTVMQGDANQVTFAASGGATLRNKENHTKSEKTYAVVDVNCFTSTVITVSGETGI